MNLQLNKSKVIPKAELQITGSKSESNRLLLLQALYSGLSLENISNSDDSQLMTQALQSNSTLIDVHHAGTAMRFLTAYYASKPDSKVILTGSPRMQERPITILVDALKSLGADISYEKKEGFPPLNIKGKQLKKNKVTLNANVSSQYISALLLIAPKLEHGLELNLEGEITSIPYIKMTLSLLDAIGVESSFINNKITVKPFTQNIQPKTIVVDSDWSSASYYYSIIALSPINTKITLSSYKENALQGDSILINIYKHFGVQTNFSEDRITLTKYESETKPLHLDLKSAPDIAQTIAVTCFGLGMSCNLTGLHTLKIKETDRLVALKIELEKLGAKVIITDESLELLPSKNSNKNIAIDTYNDHRMAMAFAPLALVLPIKINNAEVVSKSYPSFWEDLNLLGLK